MKVKIYFSGNVLYDLDKLEIILAGQVVEIQEGHGQDAKYLPKKFQPFIEFVNEDQIILEEKDTIAALRKKAKKLEEEKSAEWSKKYTAEQENEKLKKELEILRGICPHKEEDL
jgi:glutamyl-tRNA reductase